MYSFFMRQSLLHSSYRTSRASSSPSRPTMDVWRSRGPPSFRPWNIWFSLDVRLAIESLTPPCGAAIWNQTHRYYLHLTHMEHLVQPGRPTGDRVANTSLWCRHLESNTKYSYYLHLIHLEHLVQSGRPTGDTVAHTSLWCCHLESNNYTQALFTSGSSGSAWNIWFSLDVRLAIESPTPPCGAAIWNQTQHNFTIFHPNPIGGDKKNSEATGANVLYFW